MSRKAVLQKLHGKKVIRTAYNMNTVEDIPSLDAQLVAQGFIRNPNTWSHPDGRFVSVPKVHFQQAGVLEVGSKGYTFKYTDDEGVPRKSYGNIKDLQVVSATEVKLPTLIGGQDSHFVYGLEMPTVESALTTLSTAE